MGADAAGLLLLQQPDRGDDLAQSTVGAPGEGRGGGGAEDDGHLQPRDGQVAGRPGALGGKLHGEGQGLP